MDDRRWKELVYTTGAMGWMEVESALVMPKPAGPVLDAKTYPYLLWRVSRKI